ncbi:FHA domain-containing protein [bacterium]|nr:FHA domain-containing protein [bacterium]
MLRLVETKRDALSQLEESCRQAEEMREAMQLVCDLSTPLLPVLDGIASSSVLKVMAKIPGVGAPIEVIQGTAAALRGLLQIVVWMNRMDQEYQAPIRDAILKSNQLLRSRDSRDVPPLLDSYRSACEACSRIEARLRAAQTRLAKAIKLVNLTVLVLDRMGQGSDDTRRSARELADQLGQMQEIVALMLSQVEVGHRFMQQVLDAAGSPNPAKSRSRGATTTATSKPEAGAGGVAATSSPDGAGASSGSPATRTPTVPPVGVAPNPVQPPVGQAGLPPAAPEVPRRAVAHASHARPPSRRGGHSALVLLLSGLPGVAALLAIAWMVYNHYILAPQRRGVPGSAAFEAGSVNHAAALRLGARQMLILPDQPALIGSDAGRNSVYLDDPTVAPVHARIEFLGGTWWITNLSSVSGTFVDGRPVMQEALSGGQRLRFGNVEMVFTIRGGSGPS